MKEAPNMKRALLAGVVSLALVAPARAQLAVVDKLANAQLLEQAAHALASLRQLELQYQQLQTTYAALSHPSSVLGLANRLGSTARGLGMTEMGSAFSGAGSVAGSAQRLANMRAFTSTGSDWSAQEMTRKAQRLANIQTVAQQQMEQAAERIEGLAELMAEIDGQPDVQASAALQNRIQAEHAFLSAQRQQLAQLEAVARTEEQADLLRVEEKNRESAEQWLSTLAPLGPE